MAKKNPSNRDKNGQKIKKSIFFIKYGQNVVYTPTMGRNGPLTAEKGPKNLKNDQNRPPRDPEKWPKKALK